MGTSFPIQQSQNYLKIRIYLWIYLFQIYDQLSDVIMACGIQSERATYELIIINQVRRQPFKTNLNPISES